MPAKASGLSRAGATRASSAGAGDSWLRTRACDKRSLRGGVRSITGRTQAPAQRGHHRRKKAPGWRRGLTAGSDFAFGAHDHVALDGVGEVDVDIGVAAAEGGAEFVQGEAAALVGRAFRDVLNVF